MKIVHEDLIRARAYEIWESRGRPTGLDKEHWEEAERELLAAAPELSANAPAQAPAPADADRTSDAAPSRPASETIARAGKRQPRDETLRG